MRRVAVGNGQSHLVEIVIGVAIIALLAYHVMSSMGTSVKTAATNGEATVTEASVGHVVNSSTSMYYTASQIVAANRYCPAVGGTLVTDPTASSGSALVYPSMPYSGCLVYGPYDKQLVAGTYTLQVKVKFDSLPSSGNVFAMGVHCNDGGYIAAGDNCGNGSFDPHVTVFSASSLSAGQWITLSSTFTIVKDMATSYGLEVYVFACQSGVPLHIDTITVS